MRPHPIMLGNAVSFAAFVALVVTLLIRHNDLPPETDWHIVGWGVVVALGGFVGPLLRRRAAWVEIEGGRLRWTAGVLRSRGLDSELARLQMLAVEQGMLGRILGYATLRVIDEAGGEHLFSPVGAVEAFRLAAAKCGASHRAQRMGRRGN